MAFTGLVPSEHSSGPSERRGSITKTGNAHLRWALVEASWAYRHAPAIGVELRRRNEGQPPDVQAFAWHAQYRLTSKFRRLAAKKERNVAVVAVARELEARAGADQVAVGEDRQPLQRPAQVGGRL